MGSIVVGSASIEWVLPLPPQPAKPSATPSALSTRTSTTLSPAIISAAATTGNSPYCSTTPNPGNCLLIDQSQPSEFMTKLPSLLPLGIVIEVFGVLSFGFISVLFNRKSIHSFIVRCNDRRDA